jgi:S1-C subfamily serine protease
MSYIGHRGRRRATALLVVGLALGATACVANRPMTPAEIAAKANPSIVRVETEKMTGSGFVVGADGLIATNKHVIEGAREIHVIFDDGRTFPVVAVSPAEGKDIDLAVLHIETHGLVVLPLGGDVHPGDHVVAIGNQAGYDRTVSDGLVSSMRHFDGYSLVQISAPAGPGSSGGAVFDERGDVIGIVVSGHRDSQNLNFAVPVQDLKTLLGAKTPPVPMSALRSKTRGKRPPLHAEAELPSRGQATGLNASKRQVVR